MLASLISACWNNDPSRRPVFEDICKNLRAVEWDLQQREAQVQEHRTSKPQGSKKGRLKSVKNLRREKTGCLPRQSGRLKSVTNVFFNRKKRLSASVWYDQHKQRHTCIVDGEQVSTLGSFADALEKKFSYHVPQLPLERLSNDARVSISISQSEDHWSELTHETQTEELRKEQFLTQAQFDKLKGHPLIGHFFSDVKESELELGKRISEGGQAEIYEGQWRGHDGEFYTRAFKVFKTGFMALEYIPLSVFQFFTSNAIVADPSTSRVMRPLGATFLKDGRFALVMERYWGDLRRLIEIQTLKNKHIEDPPFRQEVAIEIMLQIAEGMAELHEFGIIHRDIKSANVFVRDLEKFNMGGDQGSVSCALADYEFTIGVFGTGFWRAPEILDAVNRGKFQKSSVTPSVDVYSYGMTCYEILTGKIPFEGEEPINYDPILLGTRPKLPSSVHPRLRDLVTRCWHANPSQRPSPQEIVALLKKFRAKQ